MHVGSGGMERSMVLRSDRHGKRRGKTGMARAVPACARSRDRACGPHLCVQQGAGAGCPLYYGWNQITLQAGWKLRVEPNNFTS